MTARIRTLQKKEREKQKAQPTHRTIPAPVLLQLGLQRSKDGRRHGRHHGLLSKIPKPPMLVVEEDDRAAGLEVERARGVQDGVLDNVHDAVFRDDGFGLDLHDGAADDGGVEEGLGAAFGHGGGGGRKVRFPIGAEEVAENVEVMVESRVRTDI